MGEATLHSVPAGQGKAQGDESLHGSRPVASAVPMVKLAPNTGVLGDNCSGVLVLSETAPSCSSAKISSFSDKVSFFLGVSS